MTSLDSDITITIKPYQRGLFAEAAKQSAASTLTDAAELRREMRREMRRDAESPKIQEGEPFDSWFEPVPPRDAAKDAAWLEEYFQRWRADWDLYLQLAGLPPLLHTPEDVRRNDWRRDLEDEIRRIDDERARRDEWFTARSQREDEASGMTWQDWARALFGPDYQTPLADVARVSRKTIQRADHPDGRLPRGIHDWLYDTMVRVPSHLRRAYGTAFRAGRIEELGSEGVMLAAEDLVTDPRTP